LFLLLNHAFVWDISGSLHRGEIAHLAESLLLDVRLEELAVKLVFEFVVLRGGPEAITVKVETKGLKVKIWAQKLLHLSFDLFNYIKTRPFLKFL